MILRRISIGTRLASGFGLVLAIMLGVSIVGTYLAQRSRDDFGRLVAKLGAKERLAGQMKSLALEQSSVMRNIGLHAQIREMQAEEDRARALGKRYDDAIGKMESYVDSVEERAILAALRKLGKDVEEPFVQALGLSTSFRNEEAAAVLIQQLDPLVQKSLVQLDRLIAIQQASYERALGEANTAGHRLTVGVYTIDALVLAIAALLAATTTRSIVRPLRDALAVARRVASGDLASRIEVAGADESAELLGALRDMNRDLGAIVVRIRQGADAISTGASQVAAGNQQLSSRTEEHASSLEETASTLEEFTNTVRQNAEHAREARALSAGASAAARKGGDAVAQVVETMTEVNDSSRRISEIIAVIDGLAFQTNILALNAAVEAARAGEQGRGFAVVAAEVRNLAQRSATSAKEIRALIEGSVSRVQKAGRLVEQAGGTMHELVGAVGKVDTIMEDIAAASGEQSSGIEQINNAIARMDEVVQLNASLIEEATAAATSMAEQATGLARAVAQFRLDDTGDRAQAAVQAPTPDVERVAPPKRRRPLPLAPAALHPAGAD